MTQLLCHSKTVLITTLARYAYTLFIFVYVKDIVRKVCFFSTCNGEARSTSFILDGTKTYLTMHRFAKRKRREFEHTSLLSIIIYLLLNIHEEIIFNLKSSFIKLRGRKNWIPWQRVSYLLINDVCRLKYNSSLFIGYTGKCKKNISV